MTVPVDSQDDLEHDVRDTASLHGGIAVTLRLPACEERSGAAERGPGTSVALDAMIRAVGQRSCRASFESLYAQTSGRLFGVVQRINRDPAESEEVLQEIYLRVWREAAQFDATRGQAMAWLTGMARNHAISSLRRRQSRPARSLSTDEVDPYAQLASPAPGPEEILRETQRREALLSCMRKMPLNQRKCLSLALQDGLSHSEIAMQLEQPLGSVKARLRRSLAALRSALVGL